MGDPYARLRRIVAEAEFARALEAEEAARELAHPERRGWLFKHADLLLRALDDGPVGCSVQITLSPLRAQRLAAEARRILKERGARRGIRYTKVTERGNADQHAEAVIRFWCVAPSVAAKAVAA